MTVAANRVTDEEAVTLVVADILERMQWTSGHPAAAALMTALARTLRVHPDLHDGFVLVAPDTCADRGASYAVDATSVPPRVYLLPDGESPSPWLSLIRCIFSPAGPAR